MAARSPAIIIHNKPNARIHLYFIASSRSLELRAVLLEVLGTEPHHSNDTLLSASHEAMPVAEELDGVYRSVVAADLAHLVAVQDVADVRFEAGVSCGHRSHDGRHAAAHH